MKNLLFLFLLVANYGCKTTKVEEATQLKQIDELADAQNDKLIRDSLNRVTILQLAGKGETDALNTYRLLWDLTDEEKKNASITDKFSVLDLAKNVGAIVLNQGKVDDYFDSNSELSWAGNFKNRNDGNAVMNKLSLLAFKTPGPPEGKDSRVKLDVVYDFGAYKIKLDKQYIFIHLSQVKLFNNKTDSFSTLAFAGPSPSFSWLFFHVDQVSGKLTETSMKEMCDENRCEKK